MIRLLSSVTISASGHVSASAGQEDDRVVRISAGEGLDTTMLGWIKAKAEQLGLTFRTIPTRTGGTTFIFMTTDDKGRAAVADLEIDFSTKLGRPSDSTYNGKLQRTYWLGLPRVVVNLGAYGE